MFSQSETDIVSKQLRGRTFGFFQRTSRMRFELLMRTSLRTAIVWSRENQTNHAVRIYSRDIQNRLTNLLSQGPCRRVGGRAGRASRGPRSSGLPRNWGHSAWIGAPIRSNREAGAGVA